jgi:hypothetical protein
MKHVAILDAGRLAGHEAPEGSARLSADSPEAPLGPVDLDPASEALGGIDANCAEGAPHRIPWENLKPIIYHDGQDLAPVARRAAGRRESPRAGFHFSEAAGDEGELVELKVKVGPGMRESPLAPGRAARAGSSRREPGASIAEDASCEG